MMKVMENRRKGRREEGREGGRERLQQHPISQRKIALMELSELLMDNRSKALDEALAVSTRSAVKKPPWRFLEWRKLVASNLVLLMRCTQEGARLLLMGMVHREVALLLAKHSRVSLERNMA